MKIRNVFGDKFGQDRVDLIHYLQRAGHESWMARIPVPHVRRMSQMDVVGCFMLFHAVSCCFVSLVGFAYHHS